jgi:hypothetical protein
MAHLDGERDFRAPRVFHRLTAHPVKRLSARMGGERVSVLSYQEARSIE